MIGTSWDVHFVLWYNIFTIVTNSQPGYEHKYSENITTANISHSTVVSLVTLVISISGDFDILA